MSTTGVSSTMRRPRQQAMDAFSNGPAWRGRMKRATAILERSLTEPVAQDIPRAFSDGGSAADIRMQHSVERYQAIAVRRGRTWTWWIIR